MNYPSTKVNEQAGLGTPVAAIDCGTNSTRILIVEPSGQPVVRKMRVTRLGEGVDRAGVLLPEAIERTMRVLTEYRDDMIAHGVKRSRLVATSAVRDASNGQEFLGRASLVTGVTAEVLSGEEEGRLAYAGATAYFESQSRDGVVVIDIGGGSTEFILTTDTQLSVVSLPLGCVRLTERHLRHDPPTEEELGETVSDIRQQFARALLMVPRLGRAAPRRQLIGLAGTVSTLAALAQGLDCYTYERMHHVSLSRASVEEWCTRLSSESVSRRAARPAMAPGRAPVIVGGALVLREAMAWLGTEQCLASEQDILDGLVLSLLGRASANASA